MTKPKVDDGGDAFPMAARAEGYSDVRGMSMRQGYAGMALTGAINLVVDMIKEGMTPKMSASEISDSMAKTAFRMADAMIAQQDRVVE